MTKPDFAGWRGSRAAVAWPAALVMAVVFQGCAMPNEAADRPPVLGVNLDVAPAALASAVVTSAGIGDALRVRLDWAAVESTRGTYDWSAWDEAAGAMRADGRRALVAVDTAPAWARHDPPWPPAWWVPCEEEARTGPEGMPPTEAADLARFLGAFVARYREVLLGIEVWREPNSVPHWRRTGPDPDGYAELLVAAGRAVRAAAPEVWVVSAGLTPTTDVGPCHMSDYVYLDRLARTGALETVDAVGVVISSFERSVTDPAVDREVLNARRAELLRRVLVRHGIRRPIWIVAAIRGDDHTPGDRNGDDAVGDDGVADGGVADGGNPESSPDPDTARAAWFGAVWGMARADWPWLGAMFVGTVAASNAPVVERADQRLRLVAEDGRPTALGVAVRQATTGAALPAAPPSDDDRTIAASSARPPVGSARIVRPWPERPVRGALLGVLAIAGAGAAGAAIAWGTRRSFVRRAARRFAAVMEDPTYDARRGPRWRAPGFGRAVLAALLVADGVVGWPLNAPLVPAIVVAATVWPMAAVWLVAAAAPFYFAAYALHLAPALGPKAVGPVELLIAVTVAGAVARRLLDRAAALPAPRTPRGNAGGEDETSGIFAAGKWQCRPLHPADVGVILLVAWSALSPLWAEEPAVALREWRTVIVEPAAFYAVLRLWPNRRAAAASAWNGVVAGATMAALWGLAGVAGHALGWGAGAVAAEGVVRAQGPYNSPNNLALILGRVCLGLASGWVFAQAATTSGRRRDVARDDEAGASDGSGGGESAGASGSGGNGDGGKGRGGGALTRRAMLGWAAFVACTAALLGTFSRGTVLVGLPAAALWLGVLAARGRLARRAVRWMAVAAVGVTLALAPFARTERVAGALAMQPGTTLYYRVRLWQSAVRMGLDHPVLGVGLDNFMGLYRDRYVQRDVIQERFLSHPHNVALDWWTRLGLPGAVLLAAWLVWFARSAVRVVIAGPGTDRTWAAVGAGTLVYGLAHGLLDNSFFLVDLAVYTWVSQALILAALEPTRAETIRVGPPGFEPGTNRL
ncbi:MAG: O-antigen ligase family protein [Ardenticatenales bacterium]|nr:O-antigen ligase family protein [Ardenticatenales bacterium]